jgi:hypothetical protein
MLGQLPPWADGVAEADGVAVADGVLDAVTDPAVTALVGAIANAIQAAAPAPNSASTAAAPITVCLARVFDPPIRWGPIGPVPCCGGPRCRR